MSEKKPDFDSLDLSAISKTKEKVSLVDKPEDEKDEEEKIVKPVEVAEKKTPEVEYNAWIDGKSIKDVLPEEMSDWIHRLVGIDLSSKEFDTPNKRVKAIDKVLHINQKLSYLNTGRFNKDHKVYIN